MIAVIAMFGLAFLACQRSRWRRSTIILESLRLMLVILGAVLLGGPEWVQQYRPEEKPVVAVLWDDSGSMQTRDVISNNGTRSRRESIQTLIEEEAWESLQGRAQVIVEPFSQATELPQPSDPPDSQAPRAHQAPSVRTVNSSSVNAIPDGSAKVPAEAGSNLAGPLSEVADKYEHLLGVVMASDGDWNQGAAPVQSAGRLRLLGVPVFVFPVGSDSRLPDIELLSFDVPTFAIAGKRVRIPLTIESSLPRDHVATVTMKASDGEEVSKEVRVAAMGRTHDSI